MAGFDDGDVLDAIRRRKEGPVGDRSVKGVEIEAMVAAPEGFGDDVPIDPNFHARKYPSNRRTDPYETSVTEIVQVHRLREVLALGGFTRLEAPMPDIDGEYRDDVKRAEISIDPQWFPAVENRGEGVLLRFSTDAIRSWAARPAVARRINDLRTGYINWRQQRSNPPTFPGGTYVMLHTLSHMLLQSLSARCGYPAASIRERIYVDDENQLHGVLLYTSSPDAEGTLGGLVQQARHIGDHIRQAPGVGRAVLERSRLRATLGGRQCRGAMASRRGLPRLCAGRGDLVRDVERLPGPGPRRPNARRARCCVLH